MKKFDIYLITGGLILAAALYFLALRPSEPGERVVLYHDKEVVFSASLSEDMTYTYESEAGINTIEIKNGEVFMSYADCPDQYCVKHKKISKAAETIICLPHKIVAEIEGGGASNVDAETN